MNSPEHDDLYLIASAWVGLDVRVGWRTLVAASRSTLAWGILAQPQLARVRDQFRQAGGADFFHDVRAVEFYGA